MRRISDQEELKTEKKTFDLQVRFVSVPPNRAWRLNIFMVWQGLEILCTSVNSFSASEHLLASLCLQIRNMFSVCLIFLIAFFYFPSGLCFWLFFPLSVLTQILTQIVPSLF